MATVSLEQRVATLEAEVASLKMRLEGVGKTQADSLDHIWDAFANDPIYDEAMRLGRKYRESQHLKSPRRRKR